MRAKYVMIVLMSILALSISAEAQREKPKKVNYNKTVVFDVSMTCENCKRKIEKNIAFEKGMKAMEVDLEQKQVEVTFDTRKTNEEKLIAAFTKLGYKASIAESSNTKAK